MRLLVALAAWLTVIVATPAYAKRPNILYFYVDDMGWGSIGPNGQDARRSRGLPSVQTPNIDALARSGLNFTRGYGCHVCSPARSSQQSGFHQGHTFADRNDPDNAKKAMRADDRLMGDVLSEAGYVTGYWGKWGYGGSKDRQDPTLDNLQTLPTSHGYQDVLAELHHVRAHTFFQPTLWRAPAPEGSLGGLHLVPNSVAAYRSKAEYSNEPALQNHPDYPSTGYCDDAYAFAALDFVRKGGQRYNEAGTPFFGLLAVQIPHAPFAEIEQLPEWNRAYSNRPEFASLSPQTRQWAAMVTRIDAHFGNILAALEDPNNDGDRSDSVADNTLVVFQSDNGGPGGKNNVELDANGGLRGTKGSIYEGGIRVPLVMRWPAVIHRDSKLKAGSNCQKVVDVTDLLPTFCDLAEVPAPLGIDGVSIAPTLRGSGLQREREYIIHEASRGQSSIIAGNLKLIYSEKKVPELYDLADDPGESRDLAETEPGKVGSLVEVLLGERVTEPKGFANTYHHWVGRDNGLASAAENWSDYEYSNAGITYMSDSGSPKASWVARISNSNEEAATVVAKNDLELLALEVQGRHAEQTLRLSTGVKLTGRNEIRLGNGAHLDLGGGKAVSRRWIDINDGGVLAGDGDVEATIYNRGRLVGPMRVEGDVHQLKSGEIHLPLSSNGESLRVNGRMFVAGTLNLHSKGDFNIASGETVTMIRARSLTGRFRNPEVTCNGRRFEIGYSDDAVTLTAVP